ncbi:MAG: poly(R)-hydroxyalkanoic acid synthase subunit PhaE [Caldilineaceae bacterium]
MTQWDKQTDAAMNGWIGMQQKAIQGWWDLLGGAQSNQRTKGQPAAIFMAPWEQWFTHVSKQWQNFYQSQMPSMNGALNPDLFGVSQAAMEQFIAGQEQMLYLMRMVTEAWQTILSNSTTPAEWQKALTDYAAQMRQQMASVTDMAKAMENSTQWWQFYSQETQKFMQPWLNAWWQSPETLSKLWGANQAGGANELMQLYWQAYEQTFGRALTAPSMGLLRELNEKVSQGFALWLENQHIAAAYQRLIGEAWVDAFQAFMQKLLELAQKGEVIQDQRQMLKLWVEVADEKFIALFHSDAYAKAQSAYVNSSMALRQQQRELLEVGLRMNDMPTRSSLDEAHQQIYQLRKEVKALKKAMENNAAAPTAKEETKTTSSSAKRTTASSRRKPKAAAKKSEAKPTTQPDTTEAGTQTTTEEGA